MLALQDLEQLNLHLLLEIDSEISDDALSLYKSFCYAYVFPPGDRSLVKTLVGDGHCQVQVKRGQGQGPQKRAGRPRKDPRKVGRHTNGWFILRDPTSGSIVYMCMMMEPAGNATATEALKEVLWLYPKCNCFVIRPSVLYDARRAATA